MRQGRAGRYVKRTHAYVRTCRILSRFGSSLPPAEATAFCTRYHQEFLLAYTNQEGTAELHLFVTNYGHSE